ncbi:MAG: hypothetical protein Q4C96_09630 [Planctomycetia bacterium]|nr:hypothetical protein [Planctomycetia bacterium]
MKRFFSHLFFLYFTVILCGVIFYSEVPVHGTDSDSPQPFSSEKKKDSSKKNDAGGKNHKKADPYESPDFVKTPKQLKAEFAAIKKRKIEYTGELSDDVPAEIKQLLNNSALQKKAQNELRLLMAYRAVVGVPYEDMTLNRQQMAHAVAGSRLLHHVGKLTHTPDRPANYPQNLFDFGRIGTESSNIHWGTTGSGIVGSVRGYMNDSDPSNISRVGHRRWCINPGMSTTGFGEFGEYSAMWSFDRSRDLSDYDFDFIAFPARGLTPINMIESDWAWNVSLNNKKYKLSASPENVKVHLSPAKFNPKTAKFVKGNRTLPVDSLNVSQDNIGLQPCVIFRPTGIKLQPGMAFHVKIDGFEDMEGNPADIQYWVLFSAPIK